MAETRTQVAGIYNEVISNSKIITLYLQNIQNMGVVESIHYHMSEYRLDKTFEPHLLGGVLKWVWLHRDNRRQLMAKGDKEDIPLDDTVVHMCDYHMREV